MTTADRLEEAKAYIARKGEIIQTWQSKERNCQMYAISYWVWKGEECLGKVKGTGSDLLALIDQLREEEKAIIESGKEKKMVAVAVPTTLAPMVGATFCNNCMTSQPATNTYCSGCGCRMY